MGRRRLKLSADHDLPTKSISDGQQLPITAATSRERCTCYGPHFHSFSFLKVAANRPHVTQSVTRLFQLPKRPKTERGYFCRMRLFRPINRPVRTLNSVVCQQHFATTLSTRSLTSVNQPRGCSLKKIPKKLKKIQKFGEKN